MPAEGADDEATDIEDVLVGVKAIEVDVDESP